MSAALPRWRNADAISQKRLLPNHDAIASLFIDRQRLGNGQAAHVAAAGLRAADVLRGDAVRVDAALVVAHHALHAQRLRASGRGMFELLACRVRRITHSYYTLQGGLVIFSIVGHIIRTYHRGGG